MSRNHPFARRIADAWKAFGSAGHLAEAVRDGRAPARSDLERLGTGVTAFAAIRQS